MKNYNLTLLIPIYKRYDNVYNFLRWISSNGISFNNIYLVFDKIEKIESADEIVKIYKYKNLISKINNVTSIQNDKHCGKIGLADLDEIPMNDNDENLIVLEDDVVVNELFLDQCETFFNTICSDSNPIFVGYSKTNGKGDGFFETYNFLHMWGMASKRNYWIKLVEEQKKIREYDVDKKKNIIDDILKYTFPSKVFENYKHDLIDVTKIYFLNRPDSIDIFFLYYLLQNKIKTVKPIRCYVKLINTPFKEHENPTIIDNDEMDLLNTVNWCKQIIEGKKLRNLLY